MPSGESPGVEAAPGTPPLVIVCDRDNPDDAGVGDAGGAAAKDPSTPPAGCAKAVKATPPKKKRKIFEKKLDEYPEEAETTFGSHDGPPKRRLKEKTSPESLSPPPPPGQPTAAAALVRGPTAPTIEDSVLSGRPKRTSAYEGESRRRHLEDLCQQALVVPLCTLFNPLL